MKNNLDSSTFRVLIYKKNQKFFLICYETGWVEEYDSLEEAQNRLRHGIIALLKTISDGKLSLSVINTKPSLKFRFIFYYHVLRWSLRIPFVSLSTEPFSPRMLVNA